MLFNIVDFFYWFQILYVSEKVNSTILSSLLATFSNSDFLVNKINITSKFLELVISGTIYLNKMQLRFTDDLFSSIFLAEQPWARSSGTFYLWQRLVQRWTEVVVVVVIYLWGGQLRRQNQTKIVVTLWLLYVFMVSIAKKISCKLIVSEAQYEHLLSNHRQVFLWLR